MKQQESVDQRAAKIDASLKDELVPICAPELLNAMLYKAALIRCATAERALEHEKELNIEREYTRRDRW